MVKQLYGMLVSVSDSINTSVKKFCGTLVPQNFFTEVLMLSLVDTGIPHNFFTENLKLVHYMIDNIINITITPKSSQDEPSDLEQNKVVSYSNARIKRVRAFDGGEAIHHIRILLGRLVMEVDVGNDDAVGACHRLLPVHLCHQEAAVFVVDPPVLLVDAIKLLGPLQHIDPGGQGAAYGDHAALAVGGSEDIILQCPVTTGVMKVALGSM